jgi:hypothetical protein
MIPNRAITVQRWPAQPIDDRWMIQLLWVDLYGEEHIEMIEGTTKLHAWRRARRKVRELMP